MKDITKNCDDNLGGINVFNITLVDDIDTLSEPVDGAIIEKFSLKEGKSSLQIYATEGTMKYSEDLQEDSHGDYFKAKFSCTIPKDRVDVRNTLNDLKGKKVIIEYMDNNGCIKLIGNINNPMRYRSSFNTGDKVPSLNSHTVEFYGDLLEKAPMYSV